MSKTPLSILWVAALLALAFPAGAAPFTDNRLPVRFGVVRASPARVHPGDIVELAVTARIDPGWHVYSLVASTQPGPMPTSLSIAGPGLTAAGPASEDALIRRFDPNFQTSVAFHENSAVFTLPVRVGQSRVPASVSGKLSIRYQACNDRLCDPPITVDLPVAIAVDPGAPPTPGDSGLLGFILSALAAGLLALLTPCVFPLIPVTFGYFTKEAIGQRGRLVGLALSYVAGIIVSFVLLGVIATVLLGAAGPNRVAADPWINLAFGVLFVVLAFAFFETFTPRLPPRLQGLAGAAAGRGGLVGIMFMGLAFVFTAFTCTAPFVASVLAMAASSAGGYARPILGMLAFASALSAPFLIIALFPPLLTRLPRSGAWLSRMKAVLGFVELAYAILYFSKADLVWQAHVLTRPVIFGLWAVIAVCGALYLLGALRVNAYPDEPGKLTVGRGIGIAAFAAAAAYCFYAVSGRPIDANLAAFIPEADYGASPAVAAKSSDGLDWLSDYDEALKKASSERKPVFIDFTGYTCTNCRWMEQNIFTRPEVRSRLARYVRVRLYTDGQKDGDENQKLQMRIGNAIAQPLYALLDSSGAKRGIRIGVESDPMRFASFLDEGLSAPPAPSAAWASYSDAAYSAALAAGKPIVIDFTATWCLPCHAIERTVFEDPAVKSRLTACTTLRADLTDFASTPNAAVESKFGVKQLPTIVMLTPAGREAPSSRVTGLVTSAEFMRRLALAGASRDVR